MTEVNNSNKQIFELTQGPFVVDLKIPNTDNSPEWRGRFILGGGSDAKSQIAKSIETINQLPDGLKPDQLWKSAGEIFSANNLSRIDF